MKTYSPSLKGILNIILIVLGAAFIGYVHAEAYKTSSTNYNFEDISSSGTLLLEGCDDCAKAVDIGFEFTYYGRVYTQLYVTSNGFVIPGGSAPTLGNRIACCNGLKIPLDDNMAGVIALWWVDLSLREQTLSDTVEENGKIYYEWIKNAGDDDDVFIIQFQNVRHFHNLLENEGSTFQLKIFETDNRLEMHYQTLVANQNIHTIGIESPRQDEGGQYFRTSKNNTFPAGKSSEFAISFTPPDLPVKLTSSLRYGALGNTLQHQFEVDLSVSDIDGLVFGERDASDSIVEEILFEDKGLLSASKPARFFLNYELFDSPGGTSAGDISGDYIEFKIDDSEYFTLDSQTVFISQTKEYDNADDKITSQVFNNNGTVYAFKSKANLLNEATKSVNAADVFFVGRDPDTQEAEVYQLTNLSASNQCGKPYIDDQDEYRYLYVMCETDTDQVEVRRYDLNSYLDDDLEQSSIVVENTAHTFGGDIEKEAFVVAGQGNVAYARDFGGGSYDIYLNGTAINNPSNRGSLSSLAIDLTGTKVIYVLDDILYYYESSEVALTAGNVQTAHISADGSTIAFDSDDDGTFEIFTVLTSNLTVFKQRTSLSSGECKLPVISEKAKRIAMVCNQDLLNLDNEFTSINREAVYIVENITGADVTHLLTGTSDISENITDLAMSNDGSNLSFQDGGEENTYRLTGLSKLDTVLEEITAKDYPVPFKLKGKGKSGSLIYFCLILLLVSLLRANRVELRNMIK